MVNVQDFIGNSNLFKKFEVDELLFVEIICPVIESTTSIWWHNNFFSYAIAGQMVLKTLQGEYPLKAGDCIFAKKGSIISAPSYEEDFCELRIFVPDNFIKSVFQKYRIPLLRPRKQKIDTLIPLTPDDVLELIFILYLPIFASLRHRLKLC